MAPDRIAVLVQDPRDEGGDPLLVQGKEDDEHPEEEGEEGIGKPPDRPKGREEVLPEEAADNPEEEEEEREREADKVARDREEGAESRPSILQTGRSAFLSTRSSLGLVPGREGTAPRSFKGKIRPDERFTEGSDPTREWFSYTRSKTYFIRPALVI